MNVIDFTGEPKDSSLSSPSRRRQEEALGSDLELAVQVLREGRWSHVFARDGRVVASGEGHGVLPLVATIRRVGRGELAGASLADKVVGRAALMAALATGVRAVHGEFMSEAAIEEATRRRVPFSYGVAIPRVLNQAGTDLCPFEAAVRDVEEPEAALRALEQAAERMGRPRAGAERAAGGRPRARGRPGVQWITRTALWTALAVLVPVLLHPLGVGPVFLPMHWPVLVGGALGGAAVGLAAGALAPLLSYFLTGMPPLVPPIAPLMAIELAAAGWVAGWVRSLAAARQGAGRASLGAEYSWLAAAILAGRVALGAAAIGLGPWIGLKVPGLAYVQGALLSGLPGFVLQLLALPVLVRRLAARPRP
ncbi:MAG: DUF1893 domain-containing protein [Limnochordaceae bacterium]|nr:DUF1893 domain-containing protein [Limnochordaceae bacterium]